MRFSPYSLILLAALAAGSARGAEGDCDSLKPGCAESPPTPTVGSETTHEKAAGDGSGARSQPATTTRTREKTAQQIAAEDALKKLAEEARKRRSTNTANNTTRALTTDQSTGFGAEAGNRQDGMDGKGGQNGSAHEQQIAREILGDDKDAPVSQRVARLHSGGERALDHGVATVAMGITQLSLAEQNRADNGETEENTQLRAIGTRNIAEGAREADSGRAAIDHGNAVARHENKRASVVASSPMPLRPSSFDPSRASAATNEKIEEMERVAGVPAAAFVQAVNEGWEQVVSLAGGAKGVSEAASADVYAAIPNFGTSAARSSGGSSAPPPASTWKPAPSQPVATPVAEPKPAAPERKVASAEQPRPEPESIQSLGADNLLRSLGAKEIASSAPVREERSLFQRVSRQYLKRTGELR